MLIFGASACPMSLIIVNASAPARCLKRFSNPVVSLVRGRTDAADYFGDWFQFVDGRVRPHSGCGGCTWRSPGLSLRILRGSAVQLRARRLLRAGVVLWRRVYRSRPLVSRAGTFLRTRGSQARLSQRLSRASTAA